MGNLLSKPKPQAPPRVPTDKVVPLHYTDDNGINRAIIMLFMMKFDDVLDPDKLRFALEKLLSRDDWRKLGARMRLNEKGKLDYHIPAQFDEKRPAFGYSHVAHAGKIGAHPVGSRLPRGAPSRPAIVANVAEFQSLMRRADGPRRIEDYWARDEPQLSLHVESFGDATLVSLSWPHTFLDAMGRHELLAAWTAVLEGRDADVKPLHGVDRDPLADFGRGQQAKTEPYVLADKKVSAWGMILFGLRYAFNSYWYKEEGRVICIPAAHVKALQASAIADLEAAAAAGTAGTAATQDKVVEGGEGLKKKKKQPPPFLSEGDVLSAWVTRLMIQHMVQPTSNKTVMIMNAYGLRWLLADDLLPADKAYVGNAVTAVFAYLRARDLISGPLGLAAAEVRRSIAEQGTRAQQEVRRALDRAAMEKTGYPAMYGDGGMQMFVISNWTKGRFFETNFSAAVVSGGGKGSGDGDGDGDGDDDAERADGSRRKGRVGRPSYIHTGGFVNGYSTRGAVPVIGKDAEGNYWLQPTVESWLWEKIRKTLEESS